MSRSSFWIVLLLAALLLFSPAILETLVYIGVLHEYGSELYQREPAYSLMVVISILGFLFCAINPPKKSTV